MGPEGCATPLPSKALGLWRAEADAAYSASNHHPSPRIHTLKHRTLPFFFFFINKSTPTKGAHMSDIRPQPAQSEMNLTLDVELTVTQTVGQVRANRNKSHHTCLIKVRAADRRENADMKPAQLKHSPNPNSIEFTSNKMHIQVTNHLLRLVSGIKNSRKNCVQHV